MDLHTLPELYVRLGRHFKCVCFKCVCFKCVCMWARKCVSACAHAHIQTHLTCLRTKEARMFACTRARKHARARAGGCRRKRASRCTHTPLGVEQPERKLVEDWALDHTLSAIGGRAVEDGAEVARGNGPLPVDLQILSLIELQLRHPFLARSSCLCSRPRPRARQHLRSRQR